MGDSIKQLGHLSGASRFRRISEKLHTDGDRIYRDANINFKASWFPVYFALANSRPPLKVMDLAKQVAFTHITVKNILRELEAEGLVMIKPNPNDKRSKIIKLSGDGRKLLTKLKPLWIDFSSALQSVFEAGHPDFLSIMKRIDHEINTNPIHERIKNLSEMVRIVDYKPSLKEYFTQLTGKWLSGIPEGELEKDDEFILNNPDQAYLMDGGFVFFAVYEGEVAGTVALKRLDEDSFEFAGLYIEPDYRKLGIETKLIEKCISRSKENRAEELWLQSTFSMPEAHELYYKLGFEDREAPIQMQLHKRTEIIMCLSL